MAHRSLSGSGGRDDHRLRTEAAIRFSGIKDGGKGLVTDTHIAWKFKEYPSDCVTPLFYQQASYSCWMATTR